MQRNKLLKEIANTGRFDSDILDVYSDQLSELGGRIFQKRSEFIRSFIPVFQKYYEMIAGENEKVQLNYQSQLTDKNFRQLLTENQNKDMILEYTSVGIHKDDLVLLLGDHPVKKVASQGQQKTYVVALKLAEFDFIEKISGTKPLLLLDDIFDKFDPDRVKHIIHLTSDEHFGQIFITDTEISRVKKVLKEISYDHSIFIVEEGKISKKE
jgi:DNA replication and repair protein RecF